MGLRTKVEIGVQFGLNNDLSDSLFERDITELLDTLERGTSITVQLAAGEQNFVVPFGDVAQARIVYIEADGEIEVTFGGGLATAAQITGAAGTYPTGFAGGETLLVTIDATALTVTFDDLDETLQQVINRINSVAALSGLAPVALNVGGQLSLKSVTVGDSSLVDITSGTALATLGFSVTSDTGENADPGTSNLELDRPADPSGASAAVGVNAFFLATLNTTSITIDNADPSNAVNIKVAIAGDLVT